MMVSRNGRKVTMTMTAAEARELAIILAETDVGDPIPSEVWGGLQEMADATGD
jgi:hypothetical protein